MMLIENITMMYNKNNKMVLSTSQQRYCFLLYCIRWNQQNITLGFFRGRRLKNNVTSTDEKSIISNNRCFKYLETDFISGNKVKRCN